jgi:hypothetical protein
MQQAPHARQGFSLLSLMVSAYEGEMVARLRPAEKPPGSGFDTRAGENCIEWMMLACSRGLDVVQDRQFLEAARAPAGPERADHGLAGMVLQAGAGTRKAGHGTHVVLY